MEVIRLAEIASTNTYASANASALKPWSVVTTDRQTGGRGQRGNSWESEAGKNLTFSIIIKPSGFRARNQFAISEAVALAVVDFLRNFGIDGRIKWPNDIYVGDRKICGILIEHSVLGMEITTTVAGVGLNVNQTRFLSDAPNPVSISLLTGKEYKLETLLEQLCGKIEKNCREAFSEEGREGLHNRFRINLWRDDGTFYPFRLPSGERFEGKIADVEEGGMLVLQTREGTNLRFAFKEVIFELPEI